MSGEGDNRAGLGLNGSDTYELAARLEAFFIRELRLEHRYPPLFIVGAPRSGTTLLFLHVLNNLGFGFIPNSSKAHPRAPVCYAIEGARRPYRPTLENRFGIVEGDDAPSDGWDVFNRFFPKYDLAQPIREDRLYELRNIYCLLERAYGAPIANKNIGNSIRIGYLDGLFPDALFIWIERELTENSLSLLEARRIQETPANLWWCTPPPQYFDRAFDDETERVVCQIVGINRAIREQLSALEPHRWTRVDYPSFCDSPNEILDWIRSRYEGVDLERENKLEVDRFRRSTRHRASEDRRREIEAVLKTLP